MYFEFVSTNLAAVLDNGGAVNGTASGAGYSFGPGSDPAGPVWARTAPPSNMTGAENSTKTRRIIMAAILPALYGLALFRTMRQLAPLSTIANASIGTGLGVIIYFSCDYLATNGFNPNFVSAAVPFGGSKMALFMAVMIYAFEGCGAVLPVENALADPKQFPALCRAAFATYFVAYFVIGMLGFAAFNFRDPKLPSNDRGSISAVISHYYSGADRLVVDLLNVLLAFAVSLTYPVQFFPAIEVLERRVGITGAGHDRARPSYVKSMLFRMLIVLGTFAFAFSVPKLGPIIALFGALFGGTFELLLPPTLFLLSCRKHDTGFTRAAMMNSGILVVGIAVVVAGTVNALQEL